jgi:hypothetical protein
MASKLSELSEQRMLMAANWYISSTFWAATGTFSILLAALVTTYAAWRLANPIRRLSYYMSAAPLLLDASSEMNGGLEVTYERRAVHDPHLLELKLVSRGRRDIARQDFGDQPLVFKVGAEILAILPSSTDTACHTVSVSFEGETLKIGPCLIGRHQSITFRLLADGPKPKLRSPAASLRDVDLSEIANETPVSRLTARVRLVAGIAAVMAAAALILIGLSLHRAAQASELPSAIAELNSDNLKTRMTGISEIQSIVYGSRNAQPAVLQALSQFIRRRSPASNSDGPVTAEIQAALNLLRTMKMPHREGALIDLANADLTNANLADIDLSDADLSGADLTGANLIDANFEGANLSNAYFGGATITNANFDAASLSGADFYRTPLCLGSKPVHLAEEYTCNAN